MEVGARERERQPVARLVVEEADEVADLEPSRERDHLGVTRSEPCNHDSQVVEIAQKGRGADKAVQVLRVSDVPRVHDDELRDEPVPLRPLVLARLRGDRRRIHPVRDHSHALG